MILPEHGTDTQFVEKNEQALLETGDQIQERILKQITKELHISYRQVKTTVNLLDEGNTIPFIARYRKEKTGELNEVALREIQERLIYLRNLEDRKIEVIRLIDEQGKLSDTLKRDIIKSEKLQEVEDIYRPYKQKRKTRATAAKDRGLEPLSIWMMQQLSEGSIETEAGKYVDLEKGIEKAEDAIQGAMDIIAESISDDAKIRTWIRKFTFDQSLIYVEAKDDQVESVYEMYYAYQEPIRKMPPHRILAINRGEREKILKVRLEVPTERIYEYINKKVITGYSIVANILHQAIEDAYKRLIAPSIEREVRSELTRRAEEKAIEIFGENLSSLLLQPPIKGKIVLAVDPAYRTGCKLAVIDETGKMLDIAVTYPTPPENRITEAKAVFKEFINKYRIELIAIGNGTASRESEQFVADLIQELQDKNLQYIIVNEAGASVYSASKLAQEEFPELDVAERSAVSIGRRLQDPLAELVKIDPKSIGVGQYQHDVSQKRLEESLKAIVESAVNHVGVDLNTASPSLLSYVSGVNQTIAKNIVKYREENGKFKKRDELKKVPRLGAKSYEQCVGFMRIRGGVNPLDYTPIHPESYKIVDLLFKELQLEFFQMNSSQFKNILQLHNPEELAIKLDVGIPTMKDIFESLQKPGRDPREDLPAPILRTDVLKLEDIKPGMGLKGTVRNVIDFGAFVDIGIKNDGLVHISELSDKFVKHPLDVVSVGDVVTVWVLKVDEKKGRVSLTMKKPD
ncbi:RNA-binding transcriptional accessory protein [Chengkuizengella sp. YPA3-1-1]|uniref:RNA-binding transcriptional accessory protein n=1 Tax=Chengkuizengella marina TaxID=2507566 RepID=A0A6N9Q9G5_9BACL|nr:RNA-binding transcriptional accessory protein [Chengkuizengella marina]